jgi:hypothetical protein
MSLLGHETIGFHHGDGDGFGRGGDAILSARGQ